MSSQINYECSGMKITDKYIIKCKNISNDKYCSYHKYKYRLDKPDECPICMEFISFNYETPLECGHWIHKNCLIPTNLHKCPLCQTNMKNEEILYIYGEGHKENNQYNDGNSIYFEPYELNNIIIEFDNIDNINHEMIESIFFTEQNEFNGEDIIRKINELNIQIDIIVRIIRDNLLENDFVNYENILTYIPNEDYNNYINLIRRLIKYKIPELIYTHSEHFCNIIFLDEIEDYFCFLIFQELKNHLIYSKIFALYFNLKRISNMFWVEYPLSELNNIIDSVISDIFEKKIMEDSSEDF